MKYKISIVRIAYSTKEVTVEADSQEQAEDKALDAAGNLDFPLEHTAEYELDSIQEYTK